MNKIIIMMLAFVSLAAADVTGSYVSTSGGEQDAKYGVVPHTAKLALTQDGTALTGNLSVDNRKALPIKSGTVSGSHVTFIMGNAGQVTGSFTQQGNTLTGTLTNSSGQVYSFVLVKQ